MFAFVGARLAPKSILPRLIIVLVVTAGAVRLHGVVGRVFADDMRVAEPFLVELGFATIALVSKAF